MGVLIGVPPKLLETIETLNPKSYTPKGWVLVDGFPGVCVADDRTSLRYHRSWCCRGLLLWFRVWGLGSRVWGLRVWGSGFWVAVKCLGFKVCGLGFRGYMGIFWELMYW